MGLQSDGPFGLRRRLNLAYEANPDWSVIASILGVDADVLTDYMTIPDYVLAPDIYQDILATLDTLPDFTHIRQAGQDWEVVFQEKPLWTIPDINAIERYQDAAKAAVFIQAETYEEDIMTAGPDDLDVFSIQQIIDAATDGEYDKLITVVWYIPIRRYPLPNS